MQQLSYAINYIIRLFNRHLLESYINQREYTIHLCNRYYCKFYKSLLFKIKDNLYVCIEATWLLNK